jgi:hypothetical protein
MSNYHWSLGYLIPSIKLKEDKRAMPFDHEVEEEEEEEEEEENGGGAIYKRWSSKIKGNPILCHMSNYRWSLGYLIPSINLKQDKTVKPFYHEEEEEEEEEEDGVEQFIKDLALKLKGNPIQW